MTNSSVESGLGIWRPPECPFTIEYSTRVLDDIRLTVVDAFFSLPRGGAEIGGILLGTFAARKLVISGYEPLDCEHAMGPSFNLSPRDQKLLADMVAKAKTMQGGMHAVGWYHSHTRSDIFLSDADQDIHKRFFPEPWHVALVLKPHIFDPTRGGFFFRERDGSIRGGASYQEFVLDVQPMRPVPSSTAPVQSTTQPYRNDPSSPGQIITVPVMRAPDVAPPPPLAPIPTIPAVPRVAPAATLPLETPPAPAVVPPPVAPPVPRAAPVAAPAVAVAAPPPPIEQEPPAKPVVPEQTAPLVEEPGLPQFRQIGRETNWRGIRIAVGTVAVLALCAFGFETRETWLPIVQAKTAPLVAKVRPSLPKEPVPSLTLATGDNGGQFQIRWDRNSAAVQKAAGGTIEIVDGDRAPQSVRLDAAHLKNGAFTYGRQSERIDVTLTVEEASGQKVKETTSFLGKIVEPKPVPVPVTTVEDPAVRKERDQWRQQAEKLKQDMTAQATAQAAKNKQLEKEVNELRDQLQKETRRRMGNQIADPKK